MNYIGFWNIRGLNSLSKQKEVCKLINNLNLNVFGNHETKIKKDNMEKVWDRIGWG